MTETAEQLQQQTERQQEKKPQTEQQLLVRLQRLLRVKEELWQECQPIPPELIARIAEVERVLVRE